MRGVKMNQIEAMKFMILVLIACGFIVLIIILKIIFERNELNR